MNIRTFFFAAGFLLLTCAARRNWARAVFKTERRIARALSALQLQRYGHGAISVVDRRSRRESSAAGDGDLDGWNAHVGLGREISRVHRRVDAAREPTGSDRRPQSNMRRMVIDSIRNDPDWNNGEYKSQPRGLTAAVFTLLFMISSPLQWQKQAPTREAADRFFDNLVSGQLRRADANDMLYAFDASRDYDPAPKLEKIRAPLFAINSADDQVNPPVLGIAEREIKRVKRGRFILIPISDQTRGHGIHSLPAIWKEHLAVHSKNQSRHLLLNHIDIDSHENAS